MITLTEPERSFLFAQFNEYYQNDKYRSVEPDLLATILNKLGSINISFTEVEVRRIQTFLWGRVELYAPITNQNIQFILQSNRPVDKDQSHYFNSGAQYTLSKSILGKLAGT